MVQAKNPCKRESDFQDYRPWWEPPYVVYGFANLRVKSRLEHLVETYIVRATDREFMLNLQLRIRIDHEDKMWKKIRKREEKEVEREKQLILEGKMPITQAPEELRLHPVMRITKVAQRIWEERMKVKKRAKNIKTFNYDLLAGKEEEEIEDLEMTSCIDLQDDTHEKAKRLDNIDGYISELEEDITEDDYFRIKYKDPEIEEFEELETVEDLYKMANEIIGPIKTSCGGMFQREKAKKTAIIDPSTFK